MLAVVQHQKYLPSGQGLAQRLDDRLARPLGHCQRSRDRQRQARSIGHGREVDEPGPVHEVRQGARSDLDGETRFAATANPRQRDKARCGDDSLVIFEIRFVSDDRVNGRGRLCLGGSTGPWGEDWLISKLN